ncbi:MAG: SBBP repeat-containing protein [Bryobacteraceae bacterium]
MSFEPNQGQADSTVQFLSHGAGYALLLAPGQVIVNLERQQPAPAAPARQTPEAQSVETLRMSLIGANAKANAVGMAPQPGVVSYFIGNDPKNWRSGIPTYGKVDYAQIYPGVDLVFYGNQRQLEYDFVVSPGADASRIAWRIDGARARLDAEGSLVLQSRHGQATFRKPALYQMDGTKRVAVDGVFAVRRNEVRFRLGSYDHSRTLTIDPVLSYATYLAGSATDYIGRPTGPGILEVGTSQGLAVDSAGSVYVTGRTSSVDFPMANALYGSFPARLPGTTPTYTPSTFVTKFSPDGSSLVYSTYLGGDSEDDGYAIAVDSAGEAYVAGSTTSANFPITSGAYQTLCGPTVYAGQAGATCPGSMNAFVTKLNATGTQLVYSTFLGGYGNTWATGIAVDALGRAYVAGNQDTVCNANYMSTCFPTTAGAVIGTTSMACCSQFNFISVFDPTGAKLLYSTLFGDLNDIVGGTTVTSGNTLATGAAVDSSGNFYLFGETQAGKLPTTPGAYQSSGAPLDTTGSFVTADRGFIAKFSPVTSAGGATLSWATYLGGKTGNQSDYVSGLTTDSAGNVYVTGWTSSPDFPVTNGAYSTACGFGSGECAAAHVTKLNSSGTAMVWSTYVGGARQDGGDDMFYMGPVQLDGKENVYILGTASPRFPLINPVESAITGGSGDVIVAELDPTGSNLLFSSQVGSGGRDSAGPGGMVVDAAGNIYVGGFISGPDLITTPKAFQPGPINTPCCGHGFVAKISPTGPAVTLGPSGQVEALAAESIISIYGVNMASGTVAATTIPLPTSLDGNTVTVTDSAGVTRSAPLYFVSPGQINFEIPLGTAAGTATVTIQNQNGTIQSTTIQIGGVSPGIFPLNGSGLVAAWALPVISGTQQALQPVWQVVSGNVVPLPLSLGPATEQVYLEIYGTGFRNAINITATVGGLSVSVLGWAATSQFAGEDQVNIGPLPQALAGKGSVNILITADGQAANTVAVTIQ